MDQPLRLLAGIGLEIELMIVDAETLDVRPIADQVLFEASGDQSGDHDAGRIGWSNELVLHLVELKMNAPEPHLAGVAGAFQENVRALELLLEKHGARLMPTGMHPWMDPRRETVLWPHEYGVVYQAYDRLFDCRRHGWANLQSVHVNLSFGDDEEFGRLHAAVRLLLPLLPALAASSPFQEGRRTGLLDSRLEAYRTNAARLPHMTGAVIPESVFDRAAYRSTILGPLEAEVARLDPSGILQGEWLNARGAIARFDRDAIEIRLLDAQETPLADVAISWAVFCALRELCAERWSSTREQRAFGLDSLTALLARTTAAGPAARVEDGAYARALGWRRPGSPSAGELWDALIEGSVAEHPRTTPELLDPLQTILRQGTLSQRILRAFPGTPTRAGLSALYRELCDCLRSGQLFQ